MKSLALALVILSFFSCRKDHTKIETASGTTVVDSTGFEDYTTGKWTVPYHPSFTGYEPLDGALSLYGYFSKVKEFTLISPDYKFNKFVSVKFLYKMYTGDNLVNGRAIVYFNGKEYARQALVHDGKQVFNQTFELAPDQQGKITISFFQDAETGKNIWIDDVVITTRPQ